MVTLGNPADIAGENHSSQMLPAAKAVDLERPLWTFLLAGSLLPSYKPSDTDVLRTGMCERVMLWGNHF